MSSKELWKRFWRQPPSHSQIGIGYKPKYHDDIITQDHDLGWLEVHAENYMMDGGLRIAQLKELAQQYPITCHGVGLSIGASEGLDPNHLVRLKKLNDWLKPSIFSEHLAWSSHNDHYLNDLLPMPYTREVLNTVVDHINQVQDTLGCAMLLENPSTYVAFAEHEMPETEFIHQIVVRTGCGLLLDVNNVYVTANNQKLDADAYIDALPTVSVGEIHLSGHAVDRDENDEPLLIDSHDSAVDEAVWALYERTIAKIGLRPTLIEWDSNLPEFDVLHAQALEARVILQRSTPSQKKRA